MSQTAVDEIAEAAQPSLTEAALRAVGLTPDDGAEDAQEAATEAPAAPREDNEEVVVPEGAENPDAVRNAIAAERKAAREANARAREYEAKLRQQEDSQLPLEQRAAKADQEAKEANLRAIRYEVAAESGLDIHLAPRLTGSTRDELLADAETLKKLIPAKAPVASPEGGYREPAPREADPIKEHNEFVSELFGKTARSE